MIKKLLPALFLILFAGCISSNRPTINTDLNSYFQEVAESPFRSTIHIPNIGTPWIAAEPLPLTSNQEIVLEAGTIIEAKPGAFPATTDSLFDGVNVENVIIRGGEGSIIRMRKEDYRQPPYEKGEWRHGIALRGCRNVLIENLRVESTGGDGIYIASTWDDDRIPCENIVVRNCVLHDNLRQGITITSVRNAEISNCITSYTSGTAPQAGIDIEPNHPVDLLLGIRILNTQSVSNQGSGMLISLGRLTETSEPVDVIIDNYQVSGSRQPGIRIKMDSTRMLRGSILFQNCSVIDNRMEGMYCIWNTSAPLKLSFVNCSFDRVARESYRFPIRVTFTDEEHIHRPDGGIHFENFTVNDDLNRRALKFQREHGVSWFNVWGNIEVSRNGELDEFFTFPEHTHD